VPAANERHTPITRDRFMVHLNKEKCFANVELRPQLWLNESHRLAKLKSDSLRLFQPAHQPFPALQS
jgi:hypothetical protein